MNDIAKREQAEVWQIVALIERTIQDAFTAGYTIADVFAAMLTCTSRMAVRHARFAGWRRGHGMRNYLESSATMYDGMADAFGFE